MRGDRVSFFRVIEGSFQKTLTHPTSPVFSFFFKTGVETVELENRWQHSVAPCSEHGIITRSFHDIGRVNKMSRVN